MLERIDVIMFGHVIYEMASGRELMDAVPTTDEYAAVLDDKVRASIKKIFELKLNGKNGIRKVNIA